MDIYKKYQINIENEYSIEAAGELQQPNNNTLQDIVNVGGQYIGTIVLIGSLITPFIYKWEDKIYKIECASLYRKLSILRGYDNHIIK